MVFTSCVLVDASVVVIVMGVTYRADPSVIPSLYLNYNTDGSRFRDGIMHKYAGSRLFILYIDGSRFL